MMKKAPLFASFCALLVSANQSEARKNTYVDEHVLCASGTKRTAREERRCQNYFARKRKQKALNHAKAQRERAANPQAPTSASPLPTQLHSSEAPQTVSQPHNNNEVQLQELKKLVKTQETTIQFLDEKITGLQKENHTLHENLEKAHAKIDQLQKRGNHLSRNHSDQMNQLQAKYGRLARHTDANYDEKMKSRGSVQRDALDQTAAGESVLGNLFEGEDDPNHINQAEYGRRMDPNYQQKREARSAEHLDALDQTADGESVLGNLFEGEDDPYAHANAKNNWKRFAKKAQHLNVPTHTRALDTNADITSADAVVKPSDQSIVNQDQPEETLTNHTERHINPALANTELDDMLNLKSPESLSGIKRRGVVNYLDALEDRLKLIVEGRYNDISTYLPLNVHQVERTKAIRAGNVSKPTAQEYLNRVQAMKAEYAG